MKGLHDAHHLWGEGTLQSSKVSTSLIVQFYMDCVKGPHKAHLWEEGTV